MTSRLVVGTEETIEEHKAVMVVLDKELASDPEQSAQATLMAVIGLLRNQDLSGNWHNLGWKWEPNTDGSVELSVSGWFPRSK